MLLLLAVGHSGEQRGLRCIAPRHVQEPQAEALPVPRVPLRLHGDRHPHVNYVYLVTVE